MGIPVRAASLHLLPLLLLGGGASSTVEAFVAHPSSGHGGHESNGGVVVTTTSLHMDPGGFGALNGLDAAVTSSIFGAAVAATVKLAGKNDVAPAPSPAAAETATEAAPEPEPEAFEYESEPEPPVAVAETTPPKPAEKDISTLKREVAKTVESQREMEDRKARREYERAIKKAAEEREAKAQAAAQAEAASGSNLAAVESPPPVMQEVEAEGEQAIETLGRRRHLVRRLVKKVVMPWKRWSDL